MQPFKDLQGTLAGLPGIGNKSAEKLALYFLDLPEAELSTLLSLIQSACRRLTTCTLCKQIAEGSPCMECQKPYTPPGLLCLVETSGDALALRPHLPETSKIHCLGGRLSPLSGKHPEDLNLRNLNKRLQTEKGLKEILIATSATVEGETTALYLNDFLKSSGLLISRLSFGLTVGGAFQGADPRSIQKSIASRKCY